MIILAPFPFVAPCLAIFGARSAASPRAGREGPMTARGRLLGADHQGRVEDDLDTSTRAAPRYERRASKIEDRHVGGSFTVRDGDGNVVAGNLHRPRR